MSSRPDPAVPSFAERWTRILPRVEKPARYIGGEWNEIRKDPREVRLRIALAFPDVYEVGMSYLGQKILYDRLNSLPGLAAERVFAPWPDMEEALRRAGLPLVSLETKTPLAHFDILGFSLLYELNNSNILTMLDLGGISLKSGERSEDQPLVLGGGPAAFNPEPLADIFDAFFLGDGEEAFAEISRAVLELRSGGAGRGRVLEEIGRIPGVYVPSFYRPVLHPGRRLAVPEPLRPAAPSRVRKRILAALPAEYPERIIVPHVQAVFDRVAMEVARGCPQRCRFCQATHIYFPHRTRAAEDIIGATLRSLEATGYEDASLAALSVGDYPNLDRVVKRLMAELSAQGVSLSLSSLRPAGLSPDVADSIIRVRKTGFTLVPEAGTDRLRRVINKRMNDEELLRAARTAFEQGWRLLKLYFMIGLPTEEQDDLEGIERIVKAVIDAGRSIRNVAPQIHLSVASFIPKPHTPFQWLAMEDEGLLLEKMRFLQGRLKRYRTVQLKIHDLKTSILEGVFSRGDRRLSEALIDAWRQGARFDSWRDHFRFSTWEQALSGRGLDYRQYLTRLDPEAPLPWDVIDTGLDKDFLRNELAKAFRQETTGPCGEVDCAECQACAADLRPRTAAAPVPERVPIPPRLAVGRPSVGNLRYRAFYSKEGPARFLSHNDLVNALRRAFRRAGISVLRSHGFHPKMLVSYLPALPLGMAGRAECLDFKSDREFSEAEFLEQTRKRLPGGIGFHGLVHVAEGSPSLGESLERMIYTLDLGHEEVQEALREARSQKGLTALDDAALLEFLAGLAAQPLAGRGAVLTVDGPGRRLLLDIRYEPGGSLRPQDIVRSLLPALEHPVYFLTREGIILKPSPQIDKPA